MQKKTLRLAVTAALLSLPLTGCGAAGANSGAAGSAPPATTSAVPESVAVPPSDAPPKEDNGIPAEALLQPADTGVKSDSLPAGEYSHVRPLRPCGDGRYPSDATRTDAVAVRFIVPGKAPESVPAGVVVEFIGRHSAGGAAEQFRDIKTAIGKCPGGLGKGQSKWEIVESDEDSMLVRISEKYSYADEAPSTVSIYSGVSKVGEAIVVVTDTGWENSGGDQAMVRDLMAKAEKRATAIG